MNWALEPLHIEGERATVRAYARGEFPAIARALLDPQGWFGSKWGIDTLEKTEAWLEALEAKRGTDNLFAYFVAGAPAGVSRFLRIEAANRSLEIGGTWVAPRFRRTFVNTEVKFLLLRHCFETLGAERVELRVDARNLVSQRAVLRLGATFEGVLRRRQLCPDGTARDGFLYSFVKPEWAAVKARLLELRRARPSAAAAAGPDR